MVMVDTGEHDESKVTIVMHSDVVGVVQSITKSLKSTKSTWTQSISVQSVIQ